MGLIEVTVDELLATMGQQWIAKALLVTQSGHQDHSQNPKLVMRS
jgi:hypothetical protein